MNAPNAPKRTRRPRHKKPTKRLVRYTARDQRIDELVGRCRALHAPVIAALEFGDPSTCSRRLALHVGAGLLRVHVTHLNEPNWLTLTERGAEQLVAEGVPEESLHVGRLPSAETLEHLRYLNEYRAALMLACRDPAAAVSLTTFLADHDLRRMAGPNPPELVPDAIVQVTPTSSEAVGFALEVDLAHYSARLFAGRKGRLTVALARAHAPLWGLPDGWRPVVLAPSLSRLRSLARSLCDEGAGDLWLGTTFDEVFTQGPLGRAYATMSEVAAVPAGTTMSFTRSLLDRHEGRSP